jgi:hypothetical protein
MAKKPLGYLAGSLILGTVIGAVLGVLASPLARQLPKARQTLDGSRLRKTLTRWRRALPGRGRPVFWRRETGSEQSLIKTSKEAGDGAGTQP